MPGWKTGMKLAQRRIWTFSDPMWPKPAHCKGVWGDTTAIINDCITINNGRMMVNHKYRYLFRLIPKAASTAILENTGRLLPGTQVVRWAVDSPERSGGSCRRKLEPSNFNGAYHPYVSSQPYLLLTGVREPLARFISAYNHWAGKSQRKINARVEDFMGTLKSAFECANYAWGSRSWSLKNFVHFVPAVGYFLLPYLSRAGDNETVPYIDKLFLMEDLGDLIPYMEQIRAGSITAGPGGKKQLVLPKKQTKTANVKPHEPLTAQLMKALSERPDMLRMFCRAFMQDYLCFDYPLPDECQDMLPGWNRTSLLAYLPVVSPSFNLTERLERAYKDGPWSKLDQGKMNRLLLVIIGLLMALVCWQKYQLNRGDFLDESK
eukprot:jgi/Mesvir1/24571/Mv21902-RA.2